jgi:hypothetical protein
MRCVPMLLASALLLQAADSGAIALRIRVFDGSDDVTAHSRIVVYKAGDRESPIHGSDGVFKVSAGFYDAQVIREQGGKVTGIRWAERLVVEPYPGEKGKHLEVVNLQSGYGALEVRGRAGAVPDAALFAKNARDKEISHRIDGDGYALFVVPAGVYDLRVQDGGETGWHPGIEVPADRTRFVLASQAK